MWASKLSRPKTANIMSRYWPQHGGHGGGKLSQFLVAANRIAFIDPANGMKLRCLWRRATRYS
ncbi:DUF1983 domain-containing protein [Escherichia coli]|uniref:DUF1983 domain-containing protein n=1 Tax=Escherichia coli TaxID=562 RepID=UPI00201E3A15|nr:DUF1983 domain-containing protein [Escherichia coli]